MLLDRGCNLYRMIPYPPISVLEMGGCPKDRGAGLGCHTKSIAERALCVKAEAKLKTPFFGSARDRLSQTTRNKKWTTSKAGLVNLPWNYIWGIIGFREGILIGLFRGKQA